MASSPLVAVLMLGDLGFTPWEYGLAFALPCVGGLIGARLSRGVVERFGRHRVMRTAGTLRACWLVGLAFIHPGVTGLVFVIGVEFGLITCMGVFNPVFATYRLDQLPADRIARTLSAWSITSKATTAAMTALWGLLAGVTSPRTAIAVAGLVMLATPLLLPRHDHSQARGHPEQEQHRADAGPTPPAHTNPQQPPATTTPRSKAAPAPAEPTHPGQAHKPPRHAAPAAGPP